MWSSLLLVLVLLIVDAAALRRKQKPSINAVAGSGDQPAKDSASGPLKHANLLLTACIQHYYLT